MDARTKQRFDSLVSQSGQAVELLKELSLVAGRNRAFHRVMARINMHGTEGLVRFVSDEMERCVIEVHEVHGAICLLAGRSKKDGE